MVVYQYDGSFEGLLCCIYASYYAQPALAIRRDGQQDLLSETVIIQSDPDQASKVAQAIKKKISPHALHQAVNCWRHCDPEADTHLLRYLQLGFRIGAKVDDCHTETFVRAVRLLSGQVGFEAHRFKGYVRFQKLQGEVFYAGIRPLYRILEPLAAHFARRLSDQSWILQDKTHKVAVLHRQGKLLTVPMDGPPPVPLHPQEDLVAQLWRDYFATINIKERVNPKLQQHFIPLRYRAELVEMQPDKLEFQ